MRLEGRLPRVIAYAAAAALLTLTAVVGAHPPDSRAATRHAPCTKRALSAGLARGSSKFPEGRVVGPYGCAGRYAYAAVVVDGNEIAVVYRAHGTRWFTVDRAHACEGGKVPSKIYAPACEYS